MNEAVKVDIAELAEAELEKSYEVMRELRTHLTREAYLERLREMSSYGYRLLAPQAGVAFDLNLYWGRHLFVYDLITAEVHRSRGYGQRLLNYIHELAEEENCERDALSSGFAREGAHRFYEREGYEHTGYIFVKRLANV